MVLRLASESYNALKPPPGNMRELEITLAGRASKGELLSKHTSFRIGGPADLFVTPTSKEELTEFVRLSREHDVPHFVFGGGTNILVSDRGIRGLVIWNRSGSLTTDFFSAPHTPTGNGVSDMQCILTAGSGVPLAQLARYTIRLGLAGIEWAIGIPGTLGGAIVNNAGAFDGQMSDIVREISVLHQDGKISAWDASELDFGYRTSRLKHTAHGNIILEARLLLQRQAANQLQKRASEYVTSRRQAQPREPSAGSVFTNPPGDYAGRLIEEAGLKGLRVGDAQVSAKHANFIVNAGHARASDVYTLIEMIQAKVYRRFGISLDLEIQLVGDWSVVSEPGVS